jgi:hypothetical protein
MQRNTRPHCAYGTVRLLQAVPECCRRAGDVYQRPQLRFVAVFINVRLTTSEPDRDPAGRPGARVHLPGQTYRTRPERSCWGLPSSTATPCLAK